MRFRKIENVEDVNNYRKEMYFKEMYDREFESHMKTKDHFLREIEENTKLMKENDELEKKIEKLEIEIESFNEDMDEVYEEISNYWGDQMPMMAMEEAGEFIQAISKLERNLKDKDDPDYDILIKMAKNNLTKEIGDMLISIGAIMTRYDIKKTDIQDAVDNKLGKEY